MIQAQSGGLVIDRSMMIAEAIAIEPDIYDGSAQFHLGGCSSCRINAEDTIEQAAMRHGVDLERLMAFSTELSHGRESQLRQILHNDLLQITEF